MGIALGLCMLQTPYYGVFGGLWLLCMLPGAGCRKRLPALGTALAIAALPILLIAFGISSSLETANAAVSAASAPGWSPATLQFEAIGCILRPYRCGMARRF